MHSRPVEQALQSSLAGMVTSAVTKDTYLVWAHKGLDIITTHFWQIIVTAALTLE
jgi:hypothetical protein